MSLSQGRYTWRHNQVLKCLADSLDAKRLVNNSLPASSSTAGHSIDFVQAGKAKKNNTKSNHGVLNKARDWQMMVDIGQRLVIPSVIITSQLRPDIVLWSLSQRTVYLIELTVPWEGSIEEAFERKKLRYADLAAEAEQRGWATKIRPVEVGCRGFVAKSTTKLLRDMRFGGRTLCRTIRELGDTAERSSHWLWSKRRDQEWYSKKRN